VYRGRGTIKLMLLLPPPCHHMYLARRVATGHAELRRVMWPDKKSIGRQRHQAIGFWTYDM
jgi:hypothetical protein